jgi:L-histidine N-alpha-methyltransferase
MRAPSAATATATVDVRLQPEEWRRSLIDDARRGLSSTPKELSPTWLYDERGCDLFEAITELPEYYPTRAERSILRAHALDIAAAADAEVLVELGAGSASKTRVLLDAMGEFGRLHTYAPFDVAEPLVRSTAEAIAGEYAGIAVHGVVGDFRCHLDDLPGGGRRLVAFLGGTIGNLRPDERAALLGDLGTSMAEGDCLLLGTDLVKDRGRLVAAYDDAAGVTAAFNRNVLAVLNRELGADFDVDRFEHVARFDDDEEWIEMHLRSLGAQTVRVPALELELSFADGETIRTEISAKLRPERVRDELDAAGFTLREWWTDPAGDFALSLSCR